MPLKLQESVCVNLRFDFISSAESSKYIVNSVPYSLINSMYVHLGAQETTIPKCILYTNPRKITIGELSLSPAPITVKSFVFTQFIRRDPDAFPFIRKEWLQNIFGSAIYM